MQNKWVVLNKGADFKGIGERFGISPILARLIRNREIVGDEAIDKYLNGGLSQLYNPHLLKDADCLCAILSEKITQGKAIRIIGDYDIDGVMSTYLLFSAIRRLGGNVSYQIPDRILDGYGLNDHLIERARGDKVDTILTCDNGIAALAEIAHAKACGMTVLVTDHHEIPYVEEDGKKRYLKSEADAIVNPKQPDCPYPYKNLCGAAVAYKVVQILYEKNGILEEADAFLENVAFATVGDVMDLTDENRILVREGLERIHHTKNSGMRVLIQKNNLELSGVSAYHFGFVLGPCINASGRLDTAQLALRLFLEENEQEAAAIAERLVELNAVRKDMTAAGVERAACEVEAGHAGDRVLVIYLADVHESLAGIIAGRIREAYNRPTFVLTKSEDGVKGSGRSIERYSMYDELCKCKELFTKFGGHPMAAGLSLPENRVEEFREKINGCCELTQEDFIPKIKIDIPMPVGYATAELITGLARLEPFGRGNPKPQFADRNLGIEKAWLVGRARKILKLKLITEYGERISAVYFGDAEEWRAYYEQKYGADELENAFMGKSSRIRMSVVYYPQIDDYNGQQKVQLVILYYQ